MSHSATSIAKYEVAREHLDLAPIPEAEASTSLLLCNSHYQQLYRELHFPLACAACSCQPRYGGDYTRRCPDPVQISTYLQQTLDFSGVLTAQSKICKPCYMFHRQILQKQNTSDSISAPTFDTIVANLEGKIAEFEASERKSVTDKQFFGWNVCRVAPKLNKTFQNANKAILLPELHAEFCHLVTTFVDEDPSVQKTVKSSPPTSWWPPLKLN